MTPPPAPPRAPAAAIVLALALLVPLVFVRGGDAFEPPKAALLATGAAVLLALGLAGEFDRIARAGLPAWLAALPGRLGADLAGDPVATAVLFFVASAALSTAFSVQPALSLYGDSARPAGLVTACATAAVFLAARRALAHPAGFESLARLVATVTALAAGYGLLQWARLDPIGWEWTATMGGERRIPGTLGHPNHLGALIAMALPLFVHLARRDATVRARTAWALLALPLVFVLALTLSRGAWLGAAAALAVYALLAWLGARAPGAPRAAAWPRLALGALALGAVFLLPLFTPLGASLRQRLHDVTDPNAPTSRSRVLLWRAAAGMLAERPLTGVGTDAFGAEFPRHRPVALWAIEWNAATTKAHGELAQVAATQGALGLLAALLVVGALAFACTRLARRGGDDRAAAAGALLAAFAVSVSVGFTVAATGAIAAAFAGWVAGSARPPSSPGAEPRTPSPLAHALAAIATVALWAPLVGTPWRAVRAAAPALAAAPSPAAEDALARAAALAPWDGRWWFELGRVRLALAESAPDGATAAAKLAAARVALERAERLAPRRGPDVALLAHVTAKQAAVTGEARTFAEARARLARAWQVDSAGADALELQGEGWLALGDAGAARVAFTRSATLYPDFALPLAELAFVAAAEGRTAAAADTLELALGRSWHDAGAYADVARATLAELRARSGSPGAGAK